MNLRSLRAAVSPSDVAGVDIVCASQHHVVKALLVSRAASRSPLASCPQPPQEVFLGNYTYLNTSIVTPWLTPTVAADAVSGAAIRKCGSPSPGRQHTCVQVYNHSLRVVNYFSWYLGIEFFLFIV